MKKEIINLINSDDSVLRLNNISYLKRYKKDCLGNDVDKIFIKFDTINNVNFSLYDREIKSRDYSGIIKECQEKTELFLKEVSETLINNLKNGYINI